MSSNALATLLVERQLVPPHDLEGLVRRATFRGAGLEEILEREGVFTRAQLLQILENHYFCASVDLRDWPYNPELLDLVPPKLARRHELFPVGTIDDALQIAQADPDDEGAREALSKTVGKRVVHLVALRPDLLNIIERHYSQLASEIHAADVPQQDPVGVVPATPAPTNRFEGLGPMLSNHQPIALVNALIEAAADCGATDIHVEPRKEHLVIRFRVDGLLQESAHLDGEVTPAVLSRLKVMANMDISERRVPQDGRIGFESDTRSLNLRVSSLPSKFGEKIVVRLLEDDGGLLDLDKLNMPPAIRQLHEDMVTSPQGAFMVTGPTGSGKTTTLYATLAALDRKRLNVITLEDPIEYTFENITQVQINEVAGLTFEAGMQSILRQDPDVILVGEIRNAETLAIACRAALTGHKVFSTLHTNDATQAVTRLVEMGCPPYLVTAVLRGVLAQRLVRLICEECREEYEPNEAERALLGHTDVQRLQRGAGCPACANAGYKGRMAVFEYLKVSEDLHRFILERANSAALRSAAHRAGMVTMSEFARKAVLDGRTTVAEIQRAVFADEAREQLCSNCNRTVGIDFAVCPFCEFVLKECCQGCKRPVEADWDACPGCGLKIERAWQAIYCRHCVAPIDPHLTTCPYCRGDVS